jgi:site-specific DNA recombinase
VEDNPGKMIVNYNKFRGYTKKENGELVIVPEEAEIVRLIFRLYLEGYSAKKISQYLEENGIKTATGQDKWYDSVIFKMLRNEKYMGDALLQKTYTVDFMTKKKVINKGIVPQYYVEDDHEPIIPKELFYRVQEELARRAAMNKSAVTRKKNKKSKFPQNMLSPVYCSAETAGRNTEELHGPEMAKRRLCGGAATD